jgi:Ni/Co efflux regulator RcnB
LRKYVLSFFFPKLLAHTSFATNLVLEEEDNEEERRRLSSSLGGRQDDDRRRRRSRPAGRRRRRRRRVFEGGKWKDFPKCERISDWNK